MAGTEKQCRLSSFVNNRYDKLLKAEFWHVYIAVAVELSATICVMHIVRMYLCGRANNKKGKTMTKTISRRDFAKLGLATAAVTGTVAMITGCGSNASKGSGSDRETSADIEISNETEELSCALLGKDIKIAGICVAKQEGLFEEEKLNVTFETVANLSDGATAVSEDKLDVLPFGVIPTCTFVAQGVENLVVFGGTIAEGSECIVLPKNKDKYVTVDDFADAKIAYFPMETGHLVMQGLLNDAGKYNPDNWIIMSDQQSIIQAVAKGECDCGFLNSGQGYIAAKSGVTTSMHVGDLEPDFPCCRQTTSMTAFKQKTSALTKFMMAELRGLEIINNDRERAIKALVEYSGQDKAYVENVIYGTDDYKTPMVIELDPYTDATCNFYEIMKETGNIDANTECKMEDHVDSTVYKKALDTLIERGESVDFYKELLEVYKTHNTLGK